jgi:hypothetical protein
MLPNASVTRKGTEEEKEGLFSRFSKSESAAATAIIAILLLGLAFTIISVVKLEYIPEWKIDAEQDHTYDVWNSMEGAKVRIDILSRLMESSNYSTNDFSATVPFGGGILPVFEPSKSNGRLEVNTERCIMTIKPYTTNKTVNPYVLECDGISCYLGNRQYPNQILRYENGALILADGKSSIMKQSPLFTIEENKTKDGKGNYTVAIRAVQLLGKPNSVSSNTIIPLRLTGLETIPLYNSSKDDNTTTNAFDLTIATKYPDAWFVYLNETAQDKGLQYGDNYTIKLDSNSVRFSFLPNGNKKLERLYVSDVKISAEIIPLRYQNMMKLNQWYCFDTASWTGIDLPSMMDYGSPVDFSIQNTTGQYLNEYSPTSNIFTYSLNKNNSFESTFGFSSFTEFEPQPSSVTILMIYQLPILNNPPYMTLAGKELSPLDGHNGNNWYLYKQTINGVSISDPSDLKFYLKIDAENGRQIDIDYLAVYLN